MMAISSSSWKPGASGNPNGRPRKDQSLTSALEGIVDKQELKRDAYKVRLDAARETMTQGIFRAAMNDAIEALGEETEAPGRLRI